MQTFGNELLLKNYIPCSMEPISGKRRKRQCELLSRGTRSSCHDTCIGTGRMPASGSDVAVSHPFCTEQSHAGDAAVVSTDCRDGVDIAFAESFVVPEVAPLMHAVARSRFAAVPDDGPGLVATRRAASALYRRRHVVCSGLYSSDDATIPRTRRDSPSGPIRTLRRPTGCERPGLGLSGSARARLCYDGFGIHATPI